MIINPYDDIRSAYECGDFYEVINQCNKLFSIGIQPFSIYDFKIKSLIKLNRQDELIVTIQESFCKMAFSPTSLNEIINYIHKYGDKKTALTISKWAFQNKFTTPDMLGNLIAHYTTQGDTKKSDEVYLYAIEHGQKDPTIIIYQYLKTNSKKILLEGLSTFPNSFMILTQLALVDEMYQDAFIERLFRIDDLNQKLIPLRVNSVDLFITTSKEPIAGINGKNHTMFLLGKIYPYTMVLVKRADRSLSEEITIQKQYIKIFRENIKFPEVLGTFEKDGYSYLVLERLNGPTLTDIIRKDPLNIHSSTNQILYALANLYLEMDLSNVKEYQYEDKLIEKWMPVEEFTIGMDYWSSLINFFKGSKYLSIFRDSWTDNWIIQEGDVFAIDTEQRGKASLAFDFAHFFHCLPQGVAEDRLDLIISTIQYINSQAPKNKQIDLAEFILEYHAAALYRTLLNIRSRSLESRHVLHDLVLIQNGINETIQYYLANHCNDSEISRYFNNVLENINYLIELTLIKLFNESTKVALEKAETGDGGRLIISGTNLPPVLLSNINNSKFKCESVEIIDKTPNASNPSLEEDILYEVVYQGGHIDRIKVTVPRK